MKQNFIAGQEAIEFILITALVFFGALVVMLTFSNKLSAFFETDSSVAKVANNTVAVVNPNTPSQYTPDYVTKAANDNNKQLYDDYQTQQTEEETTTTVDTKTIAGLDVDFNADGSASFTVGSQQIALPAELLNLQDLVMETSGSAGAENLINEIAYMIQQHESEYPAGQVPIEISYGNGEREGPSSEYEGNASVNTTSIQIGNHLIVIQKDQTCSGGTCAFPGTYRIEGTIDSNNKFSGTVSSDASYNPRGPYTATIDTSNGLNLVNGKFTQTDNYNWSTTSYEWDIDFNNSSNSFQI